MGSKEPMCAELESAEADSSLSRSDMEIAIVFLKILGFDILHDNFIRYVTGGCGKVSPAPYAATPELPREFLVFREKLV